MIIVSMPARMTCNATCKLFATSGTVNISKLNLFSCLLAINAIARFTWLGVLERQCWQTLYSMFVLEHIWMIVFWWNYEATSFWKILRDILKGISGFLQDTRRNPSGFFDGEIPKIVCIFFRDLFNDSLVELFASFQTIFEGNCVRIPGRCSEGNSG